MTAPRSPRSLGELAADPIDEHDQRVLDQLAAIYDRLDPVPSGLVERIQFGITLNALEAEVALLSRSDLAGVRSDDTASTDTVTFSSSGLTTMITITPVSADRARIDGWVAPGGGVAVELRTSDGTRTTVADADGRFVLDDVPRGLVAFVLRPPGDGVPPVVTPSIKI